MYHKFPINSLENDLETSYIFVLLLWCKKRSALQDNGGHFFWIGMLMVCVSSAMPMECLLRAKLRWIVIWNHVCYEKELDT